MRSVVTSTVATCSVMACRRLQRKKRGGVAAEAGVRPWASGPRVATLLHDVLRVSIDGRNSRFPL